MLQHARPGDHVQAKDPLLKPREAARQLRVTPVTLRGYARRKQIASVKLPSGHRRYYQSAVDAVLATGGEAA